MNVLHFVSATPNASVLTGKLEAHVTQAMWGCMSQGTSCGSLTLTPLDGNGSSVVYGTSGGTKWAGASASGSVIPQVAALVSHRTGVRGRSFRGRTYLPFVVESLSEVGKLDATTKTSMQTAWTAFVAAMAADTAPLCIASYKLASQALVTTSTVESNLATQRLRQPR